MSDVWVPRIRRWTEKSLSWGVVLSGSHCTHEQQKKSERLAGRWRIGSTVGAMCEEVKERKSPVLLDWAIRVRVSSRCRLQHNTDRNTMENRHKQTPTATHKEHTPVKTLTVCTGYYLHRNGVFFFQILYSSLISFMSTRPVELLSSSLVSLMVGE